jgi:hypothetical protein
LRLEGLGELKNQMTSSGSQKKAYKIIEVLHAIEQDQVQMKPVHSHKLEIFCQDLWTY